MRCAVTIERLKRIVVPHNDDLFVRQAEKRLDRLVAAVADNIFNLQRQRVFCVTNWCRLVVG